MVTTQKIANKINAELNSMAAEMNIAHEFKLMAHLGKGKDDNKIYGVLKVAGAKVKNTGGTTAGVISTKVTYVAEFITPTAQDNYYATTIEQVIGALVDTQSGGHFTENGETVVWTIERGVPKDYALRDNVGSSIPIAFTINATISANGLLNGVKEWRLDGQLIPYSKEVIVLNKDGVTISIAEFSRQKSVMLAQMQEFRFTIPYDKTNTVCTTLQNDILNGDFRKTYTLSYSDGVVSFSRVVSLYRSGDMGTQDGDSTDINVSFVEAGASSYTEGADTVTYKLGLFTFPFGKNSDNTLYFDSQANQQTYMNTQVANASGEQVIKAPNLNNTLTVSTSFDAGLSSAGVYEIVNYNYAVLKREVTNAETMYLYYWVNNATIGADGMVMLELEQDTVQTIMFNPNLKIPDCLIERAHLNRWIDNGDGTVSFDGSPSSEMFVNEGTVCAKRLTNRTSLPILWDRTNTLTDINAFCDEYIGGWLYIYLTKQALKAYNLNNTSVQTVDKDLFRVLEHEIYGHTRQPGEAAITFPGDYGCVCIPVFKKNAGITLRAYDNPGSGSPDYKNLSWSELSYKAFFKENSADGVIAIKYSKIPPFDFSRLTSADYSISGNSLQIFSDTYVNATTCDTYVSFAGYFLCERFSGSGVADCCLYYVTLQSNLPYVTDDYTLLSQLSFPVSSIVGGNASMEYNPKMLAENFTELRIVDGADYFIYDKQKLNKQSFNVIYNEALTPDTTREYARVNDLTTGVYIEGTEQNLTGLVCSKDNSLVVSNSSYLSMIANTKNYCLQKNVNNLTGFANNVATGIGSIATGNIGAGIGQIGGSVVGTALAYINDSLAMDNMKSAPDKAQNANGNVIFNAQITTTNLYIEEYDALFADKKALNDYMFVNGFKYGKIDNPKNYLHTRKFFNYIKAEIEDIQGVSVSNMIRENFKQRFSNGIRFWNYATFATNGVQYDLENYELWLED